MASNEDSKRAVAGKLKSCIQALLDNDSKLLALNTREETITHKLAEYLAVQFPSWDVDCEYNRLFEETKRLNIQGQIVRVIPDIIVHHRNTLDNLLVIEAKKKNNPRGARADKTKLRAFRNQLRYKHAIFLRFRTGKKPAVDIPVWI